MSEGIIIALITAIGSLLGGIIGQTITASATVKAAQIKEKVNQSSLNKDEQTPNSWGRIIVGTLLGAIVTLIVLFMLGMIPPSVNPPVATATKASPTKISSTSTPSGSVPKFLKKVTVPANLASGINYKASESGTYTLKYADSAFTAYSGCWSTEVVAYFGPVPRWKDSENLDFDQALFAIGDANCSATKENAISRAQGHIATVKLNKEDIITLIAGDSYNLDNVGSIILDIYFVAK